MYTMSLGFDFDFQNVKMNKNIKKTILNSLRKMELGNNVISGNYGDDFYLMFKKYITSIYIDYHLESHSCKIQLVSKCIIDWEKRELVYYCNEEAYKHIKHFHKKSLMEMTECIILERIDRLEKL